MIKPVEINASLLLLSLESGPLSCLCKKQLCGLQSEDLPFEDMGLSPERALVFLVHSVRAHGIPQEMTFFLNLVRVHEDP